MLPDLGFALDTTDSPVDPQTGGFHRDLLIVGLRPTASRFATQALGFAGTALTTGPGLSALDQMVRTGQVKRVVPLGGNEVPVLPMGLPLSSGLGLPSTEEPIDDPDAGVNLLELADESELPRLAHILDTDPDVAYVARVPVRYLASPPTVLAIPPPGLVMWNLQRIEWARAQALPGFQDATGIRVAVLDTGIDLNHPDLQGRIESYVHEYPDPTVPVLLSAQDIVGHGTHVAGTIGAVSRNSIGIDGICSPRLHAYKIFDDQDRYFAQLGYFTYAVNQVAYRRALSACRREGIEVVNLSIGGSAPPDAHEQSLFDALLRGGTTIVAAMGNARTLGSPRSYPAAIPGIIAVGATEPNDRVASFSNGGQHISLCAPGIGIWSTQPTYAGNGGHFALRDALGRLRPGAAISRETDYASLQGTSMAAPHVSAAAALLLANKGLVAPSDVRQALMASADPVPLMGGSPFHVDYGAGRLNLLRLLT